MSPSSSADRDGCSECGHSEIEVDPIATIGGGPSKMFDIQNRQFVVVSCVSCGYSEFYCGQPNGNFVDLFLG